MSEQKVLEREYVDRGHVRYKLDFQPHEKYKPSGVVKEPIYNAGKLGMVALLGSVLGAAVVSGNVTQSATPPKSITKHSSEVVRWMGVTANNRKKQPSSVLNEPIRTVIVKYKENNPILRQANFVYTLGNEYVTTIRGDTTEAVNMRASDKYTSSQRLLSGRVKDWGMIEGTARHSIDNEIRIKQHINSANYFPKERLVSGQVHNFEKNSQFS